MDMGGVGAALGGAWGGSWVGLCAEVFGRQKHETASQAEHVRAKRARSAGRGGVRGVDMGGAWVVSGWRWGGLGWRLGWLARSSMIKQMPDIIGHLGFFWRRLKNLSKGIRRIVLRCVVLRSE